MNEAKLKQFAEKYLTKCRPGDWRHSLRVVKWVKELGEGREDLDALVIAAYIHDVGWYEVLPSGDKLTKVELKEYEPTANQNTAPMVKRLLDEYDDVSIKTDTILRLIDAADQHKSSSDDEAIIVDADNLSKLNIEHISEKYKESDWMKMCGLWESEFSERIQTEKGKQLYPQLLCALKEELKQSV